MNQTSVDEIVEIELPSKTKHLHAIRMLTQTLAQSMGFGTNDSEKTALAVEEALSNVIEHAYHGEEGRKMRVIYEMERDKFTVRILHNGDQMDSASFPLDDLAHYHRQKKKGGLGILIMKKCMDEVTYKSGPRQNECCMIKYLRK